MSGGDILIPVLFGDEGYTKLDDDTLVNRTSRLRVSFPWRGAVKMSIERPDGCGPVNSLLLGAAQMRQIARAHDERYYGER